MSAVHSGTVRFRLNIESNIWTETDTENWFEVR